MTLSGPLAETPVGGSFVSLTMIEKFSVVVRPTQSYNINKREKAQLDNLKHVTLSKILEKRLNDTQITSTDYVEMKNRKNEFTDNQPG